MFRFVKMRPIATAAKKVVSKIMSVRIFRSRSSTYVPFNEWEAKYLSENLQCERDTRDLNSGLNGEESEEGIFATVLRISGGLEAQAADVNQTLPLPEMGKKHVGNVQVSDFDHTDEGYCENEGNETGVPGIQLPSDVAVIKEITSISHQDALARKTSIDVTSEFFPQAQSDTENAPQDAPTTQSQLSSETVDTVVSDNLGKSAAREYEDSKDEIKSSPTSEPLIQSSTSHLSAERSSLDSRVQNDASTAFDSIATGSGADKSCKTTDNVGDDVEPSQNLKGKQTFDLVTSDDLSKSGLNNFDAEKAERIELRRKRLAKKREARIRKAMEYTAREAAKSKNHDVKGLEVQPQNNASPIVADMAHDTAPSSTELKTESEISARTENISERARWSREAAQEARERRKRNQIERLLSLMEICIAKN